MTAVQHPHAGDATWSVDLGDGAIHVVSVAAPNNVSGPARRFVCDGTTYSLGGVFHVGPRLATFQIGGHPATLSLRLARPSFGRRWRLMMHQVWDRYQIGGRGLGLATGVIWAIYQLTVDGRSQGSRVATITGFHARWTAVAPGGALPDSTMSHWPRDDTPARSPAADGRPAIDPRVAILDALRQLAAGSDEFATFAIDGRDNIYAQVACGASADEPLRGEVVGNAYLAGADRLDSARLAKLTALGWSAAHGGDAKNLGRTWARWTEHDADTVASDILAALEVYGLARGDRLAVTTGRF